MHATRVTETIGGGWQVAGRGEFQGAGRGGGERVIQRKSDAKMNSTDGGVVGGRQEIVQSRKYSETGGADWSRLGCNY